MRKVLLILLSLLLNMVLMSCGDKLENNDTNKLSQSSEKELVKFSKDFNSILNKQQIAVTPSGELAYLSKEKGNLIYSDSTKKVIIRGTPAHRFWLYISGKYVYVFWWVKFNTHEQKNQEKAGKTLYVNVSNDGGKTFSKAKRLNDYHGVLPDLHVQATPNGHISIVYLDERYQGHQIFINSSQNGGETWLEHDVELNQVSPDADNINKGKKRITAAVSPSLVKLGDKLIVIWQQIENFKGKSAVSFMSRTSDDYGVTWSQSELIYRDFNRLSVELYSTVTDNEAYLFAVLEEGLVMFSKKNEEKWKRSEGYVPGTEKGKALIVSYFKTTYDKDYLYVTYINVEGSKKEENHTEFQAYSRKDKKWINRHRFDILDDSYKEFSRSYYQDIGIANDGSLLVIWEDYRGILPSIFMSSSIDQGQSWSRPIPLNKVGLESASLPFQMVLGNKFSIFYKYIVIANAIQPQAKTRQIMLPSPKDVEFKKIKFPAMTLPNKKESLSLLRKNINTLMTLRKNTNKNKNKKMDNMLKEWEFLDPIYKSFTPQIKWLEQRGMFDYIDYKIEDISLKGTTALVKLSISYKMNNKFLTGKSSNQGKIQRDVTMTKWGWFYDNWYLIPDNPRQSYLP